MKPSTLPATLEEAGRGSSDPLPFRMERKTKSTKARKHENVLSTFFFVGTKGKS